MEVVKEAFHQLLVLPGVKPISNARLGSLSHSQNPADAILARRPRKRLLERKDYTPAKARGPLANVGPRAIAIGNCTID